jgi:hypothetical protein
MRAWRTIIFAPLNVQLEFAEGRATQLEQGAVDMRKEIDSTQAALEANRQLLEEKDERLEQLESKLMGSG